MNTYLVSHGEVDPDPEKRSEAFQRNAVGTYSIGLFTGVDASSAVEKAAAYVDRAGTYFAIPVEPIVIGLKAT